MKPKFGLRMETPSTILYRKQWLWSFNSSKEQFAVTDLIDRAPGYDMEAHLIDGNNILKVFQEIKALAKSMRQNPRPILVEFKTFRQRGHEEASGVAYVPKALQEKWKAKDPVVNYENYLLETGVLTETAKTQITEEINAVIQKDWEKAKAEPGISSNATKRIRQCLSRH